MLLQLSTCSDYNRFSHKIILIDLNTNITSLGLLAEETNSADVFFKDKANSTYQNASPGKAYQ